MVGFKRYIQEVSSALLNRYHSGAGNWLKAANDRGQFDSPKAIDRYKHYERASAKLRPGSGHLFGGTPKIHNSEHEKKVRDDRQNWADAHKKEQ